MPDLDDPKSYQTIDPSDMLRRIRELPQQIRDAWRLVSGLSLPQSYRQPDEVVVLGMGGSAIGGDLLRTLVAEECTVPISVCREYDLPGFVDEKTLVIVSSYSGETEETLSAFAQARERRAKIVVVTTGGRIGAAAQADGLPMVRFQYDAQPRAALGFSFIPLLGILQQLGFIGPKDDPVEAAAEATQALQTSIQESVPAVQNPAKQMAVSLKGKVPIVYGAGFFSEVARRWKGQFNENSKTWSFYEILPELNHNAVVGYEFPAPVAGTVHVIFLQSNLLHPRVLIRYQVTQQLLQQAGVAFSVVGGSGAARLSQMMTIIHFGDYVSYYLAILNGVDPTPVQTINYLKQQLAQSS